VNNPWQRTGRWLRKRVLTPFSPAFRAISPLSNRLFFALNTVKDQVDGIQALTASESTLINLAQSLKYTPQKWSYIHHLTAYYDEILSDIRDIYPDLTKYCVILLNVTTRELLVSLEGRVLPIIFMHKGGVTKVHRLVAGPDSRWLLTLSDELQEVVTGRRYAGGEVVPPHLEEWEQDGVKIAAPRQTDWAVCGVDFGPLAKEEDEFSELVRLTQELSGDGG